MKKLILLLISMSLFSNLAFADCDFSTGITAGPNNTYVYSQACHLKVGQLVKDNAVKDQQIADLNKSITLYKLTIQTDEERIQNWITTSATLEKTVQETDKYKKDNEWLYFSLGVLTTFAAGYAAAQLAK